MPEQPDRIVYVCGRNCKIGQGGVVQWGREDLESQCPVCKQTVTAVNLDRLLRLNKAAVPAEVVALVRWLAGAYWEGYDAMQEHAGDAIVHFPLIQRTRVQIKLRQIGKQECDKRALTTAIEWMLADAAKHWKGE